MLSKKYYDGLANVCRATKQQFADNYGEPPSLVVDVLINNLADYLEKDNPLFNREKFINASEWES